MNRPEINPQSNLSFSFHRNKSFREDQYAPGWELCDSWDLLQRAMTKVAWSSCIWSRHPDPSSVKPWIMRGYQNYLYRAQGHFLFSDFMALDIDDGASIEEVAESLRDSAFIIGTTKSHRKEKITDSGIIKPPCDRFRLVVPWERRITNLEEFRASMQHYGKKFGADRSKLNGGMYFWPCKDILFSQDPGLDLELATVFPAAEKKEYTPRPDSLTGELRLSRNVDRFLADGIPFSNGRNNSCFFAALELKRCGVSMEEAYSIISSSKFSRIAFKESEILPTVKSAYK